MTYARVPRWRVGAAATLSLVATAILYASPLLLAATVVPLGYVVYGAVSAVPQDADLRVERTVHDTAPAPADRVEVTVSVENTGPATLADLRVVDGVPAELAVCEGSPRRSLTLRPGESESFTYALVARRGEFAFEQVAVRIRSLAATAVLTRRLSADGDVDIACLSPLTDAPGGSVAPLRAGTHPTDSGGPGTEFRSTREYRPGDPKHRIHWRRYAKTGELTTVSFREERAVRVVLVVDARAVNRVSPRPGVPTGADLCGYAGERLYESLVGSGVVTSVTAVGVDAADVVAPVGPGGFPWADAETDGTTAMARAVFAAVRDVADGGDDAGAASGPGLDARRPTAAGPDERGPPDGREPGGERSATAPDGGERMAGSSGERARLLLAALPDEAEVVLLTPLLDDWPTTLVRTLRSQHYPVSVLSPDVTGTGTPGGRVAGVERARRLETLEGAGATTVGWRPGDALELALSRSVSHLLGGRS